LSLGPRSSPEEFADDEAMLRGTPLLPTSLQSSPAIPELSPSFPASQQSSDSEEATLRGTPLLPTSLRSSPAIPELSPSFPASQQSSDSEEDDTQAGSNVLETTYSSVGRRTWDARGGMGGCLERSRPTLTSSPSNFRDRISVSKDKTAGHSASGRSCVTCDTLKLNLQ